MRAILSVVVVLSAATASFAADRKVGPNAPYETIQAAVDAASPGDRILISPGTYTENVVVPAGASGLQFVGRNVVWDGTPDILSPPTEGAGWCLTVLEDDVVVKGIAFRNGARHVVAYADGLRVSKCAFTNAHEVGVWVEGRAPRVESCRFRGGIVGVDLQGADAVVRRNDFRNVAASAVQVRGDDALVERNVARTIGWEWAFAVEGSRARVLGNTATGIGGGIGVHGEYARVAGNRMSQASLGALFVEGNHADVEANRVKGAGDTAIRVVGDDFDVARNTVSDVVGGGRRLIPTEGVEAPALPIGDVDGIFVGSLEGTGGGSLTGNRVTDAVGFGFFVYSVSIDVRGNIATRCGAHDGGGFFLFGVSNVIESNVSAECIDTAFSIQGGSNTLRGNLARDATGDGFQVSGSDNDLERNAALGCGGEGLHNAGTGTDVTGCRFTGNRIDVACDVDQGATFSTFHGNTFVTGGEDRQPEVDFPWDLKLVAE